MPTSPASTTSALLSDSMERLKTACRDLPNRPGVYMMTDANGRVIYIGKAVNLRRRAGSYATPSAVKDGRLSKLVMSTESLSHIETPSELEALLLESRLIKQIHPTFNRRLVEPESSCYVKFNPADRTPRIEVVAWVEGNAERLGPFWSSSQVRVAVEAMADVFKLRRCPGIMRPGSKQRACIYYEIGKCSGPCSGKISADEYGLSFQTAWHSLAGRSDEALNILTSRRNRLVEELRFESAHSVHRQIIALGQLASYASDSPISTGDFGVVVPSHLERRPSVLLFADGRLGDRLIAAPNRYPEPDMLANRLKRLRTSKRDLLPGRTSVDDRLIIRSYTRRYQLGNALLPLESGNSIRDLAFSLHRIVESQRY